MGSAFNIFFWLVGRSYVMGSWLIDGDLIYIDIQIRAIIKR